MVVADISLPANHDPTEVVHPSEEALDLPTPSISTKWASILSLGAVLPVRGDQLDLVLLQPCAEFVAVVGFIRDDAAGPALARDPGDDLRGELNFGWRCAVRRDGERNAVAIDDGHDLAPFAALGRADAGPPFLAGEKVASMKLSSQFNCPAVSSRRNSAPNRRAQVPSLDHRSNQRQQVWYGGYSLGRSFQRAPERRIHNIPSTTGRSGWTGRPRPSARRLGMMKGAMSAHCSSVRRMLHG